MFLIDHYVAPSKIHGLGVFAAEPAPAGAVISRFNPYIDIIVPEDVLPSLPAHVVTRLQKRAEYVAEKRHYVLGADGDAFMNHSEQPNLDDCGDFCVALTDIAAGEEITCDYRKINLSIDFI